MAQIETTWTALAMRVIAVAKTRVEGTWKAYIDAVPGNNHEAEWPAVLAHGTALDEKTARAIFPFNEDLPYAR